MTTKISTDLHDRAPAAEPQLQVESPDDPEAETRENPQDSPSCTRQGSRAEESKINKLEGPHHDQADQPASKA